MAAPTPVETLTEINLDDLIAAFGFEHRAALIPVARWLFRPAARKFAQQMIDFDWGIAAYGLVETARRALRLYVGDVQVFGRHRLPLGPILAVSNHPGLTDSLLLVSTLNRPSLSIIALNRPFLLSLPHLRQHLSLVDENPGARVALVRSVSRRLRHGGAVLTFPAGRTEPDPDVHEGAVESLQYWSNSLGVFMRLAPGVPIVPLCVRGVFWHSAVSTSLAGLRHSRDNQQLLASALQLLSHLLLNNRLGTARVQIGQPITREDLGSTGAQAVHEAVLVEMKRMIERPPEGDGESLL